MKNGRLHFAAVLIILFIPLIYLAFVFKNLPQQVPIHFDMQGNPNGYSTPGALIWLIGFMILGGVGPYLLLTNLHKIDPKKNVKLSSGAMNKIALAIVILFTAINIIIIYSAANSHIAVEKILLPLLGLFFAYLGNIMYSVKPNYFVGIRTPWALEDEDNWRKTHKLAGKLWVAGGLLITVVTLMLGAKHAHYFFMSIILFISLIPAAYSYLLFKRSRNLS